LAIPGKKARIRVMGTDSNSFLDEPTTANSDRTIFTITDRDKRYWDRSVDIVVHSPDLSTVVPPSEYRIQHAGGRIHFREPRPTGEDVWVSGAWVNVTTAAQANEYTISMEQEIVDVTWFNPDANGFRERMANLHTASGSLSGFYHVDELLSGRILSQQATVIEMQPNADDDDHLFAVYAFLNSDEINPSVEGAVEFSVSWDSDGEILVEPINS
jgi:hypothetical protein